MFRTCISFLISLFLVISNAFENWNTPRTSVEPAVRCPEELVEIEVNEASNVVSSTSGIRIADFIPLLKSDYDILIEKARKIANEADANDDFDLEETTRARIRELKKQKKNVKSEDNPLLAFEPTIYKKEGRRWNVLHKWSLDWLKEKYGRILVKRSTSVPLENGGVEWNEVELSEYLTSSFRQQKLKITDYEELLLAESAPNEVDKSDEDVKDPTKFLEAVEKTAAKVFVDYDTWDDIENPEGEFAFGRLKQIQSQLLKDKKFKSSYLYKVAKNKKSRSAEFHISPPGSGQTFNRTQGQWIAVIQGSLRVFLYPPTTLPPYTYPQRASLAEWVDHIYPRLEKNSPVSPLEITVLPGNVLHVPTEYHMAMLSCSETMFVTLFDEEKQDSPHTIIREYSTKLQKAIDSVRKANIEESKQRDEKAKQKNAYNEDTARTLSDISEEQTEMLNSIALEGLKELSGLVEKYPNRPDLLLAATDFELIQNNFDNALRLTKKAIELIPKHSAGYFQMMTVLRKKLQNLLEEVDRSDSSDVDEILKTEAEVENFGNADPTDEQMNELLDIASKIVSCVKSLLQIDQSLRWTNPSSFVAAYNDLALLEAAIGKKRLRPTIGVPEHDSADATDPFHLELMAFD